MGRNVVVVRHPMPYGDLVNQVAQRFSSHDDCLVSHCTIEEREEYEPLIDNGIVVYAGVDYERILREAEKEADVIVWGTGFPLVRTTCRSMSSTHILPSKYIRPPLVFFGLTENT